MERVVDIAADSEQARLPDQADLSKWNPFVKL
jgi:hypothetical protein